MAMNMTAAVTIKAAVDGLASILGLEKALGKADKEASGLKGAFQSLGRAGQSFIGIIGAAGIGAALKQSIDTFSGFQAETKLLENGLKNVGAAAGELDKLQKIASDLGEATLFNEEDFRRGFGLLTSFGNIGAQNYERVAKAAADVAYTSGTEVSGAFMQLAKALNDPAKGLAALGDSGIQFSEDQKTVIERLVETNQLAKAQGLILQELEKQYGGNAVAAAQGLAGAFDTLGEKFYDLQVALGPVLEQLLGPLIVGLTRMIDLLANAPGPVQTLVVAIGGLGAAIIALAPVIAIIGAIAPAFGAIVPVITAVIGALAGLPAVVAGIAGAIGPVIVALKAFGVAAAAVLSGPVGIVALVVAAGVAIYAFRDKIADAFGVIGKILVDAAGAFKRTFVDPVIKLAGDVVKGIANAFRGLADALRSPFDAVTRFIRNIFNGYLSLVQKFINSAVNGINKLISAANRALAALKLPNIPLAPTVTIPRFAQGGTVDRPTLAMVGEGGQREYIIPESKMARASANYLMGARGAGVVPGAASSASQGNTTVQITTGPVLQQGGQRYVTIEDLERSLNSLAANLLGNNRSFAGRRFQGAI